MLHLGHYTCLPPHSTSSSSITSKKNSIFLSGFRENELLGRRNGSVNGVDKDSEFEVDPDRAREALRMLDDQLQSLSNKQIKPPKIRGVDINESSPREIEKEEASKLSGSFLAFAASFLLVFTILYNIIFLTVIKPSIDGPEAVQTESMIREAQERASLRRLSRSAQFPAGP